MWVVGSLACSPSEPAADVDADTDADADTDVHTDTDVFATERPTVLEATCTPDVNVLQFWCDVAVEPAQAIEIRSTRTDGLGVSRTTTSDLVSTTHHVPVIFLAPERAYTLDVAAVAWPDDPVVTTPITTGLPPASVGSWLEWTGTSTLGLIGTESGCSASAVATIYDTVTGDLVWYRDLDPQGSLGLQNMVRFTEHHTILGDTNGSIVEIDLFGSDVVRFDVDFPGLGVHHDLFRRDDLIYVLIQEDQGPLTLDSVVVLDLTGTEVGRWRSGDHLDIPVGAMGDLLHTNGIHVDTSGDLLLSMLGQASIAKITGDLASPDFGDAQWIMTGAPLENDIGDDITIDWVPIGPPTRFARPHHVSIRHDGRLMFLDNSNGRALVMTMDELAKTATADAAYATAENSCGTQGTALDTWAGNAVVGCDTGTVREYDVATGSQLWEAKLRCRNESAPSVARWYPLDGW
jgi:hypothetical protein